MILPHSVVSAPRCRALATRKPARTQPGRQSTVRVNALFGMGAPSGGNNEAVDDLVNSRLGGPSEAGNAKVADAVRPSHFDVDGLVISALSGARTGSIARAGCLHS